MNYEAVYRTAPATPGLLISLQRVVIANTNNLWTKLINRPGVAGAVLQIPS